MTNHDIIAHDPTTRCCAYCYLVPVNPLKTCSLCKSRAYCSRECQGKDWKQAGHKYWCKNSVGEKGTDYCVKPMECDKGYGLVALRKFPKGSKILVERPVLQAPHEASREDLDQLELDMGINPATKGAILALGPADGSLGDKFLSNRMKINKSYKTTELHSGLFVTLARANHACIGNCGHYYDAYRGVEVLVATQDIEEGTEITFSYVGYHTAANRAKILKQDYGFDCDCSVCETPELSAKMDQALILDGQIDHLVREKKFEEAIGVAEELLELHLAIGSSHTYLARTHFDLFQLNVSHMTTLPKAKEHIKQAHEYSLSFFGFAEHPMVQQYKLFLDDPQKHPDYLRHSQTK